MNYENAVIEFEKLQAKSLLKDGSSVFIKVYCNI